MAASVNDPALNRRLGSVKNIILVLSGKGGVGKSSVSVQLALSLLSRTQNSQVGLLDIDLTGPSIPRMLGLEGRSVLQSTDGWLPVQTGFTDQLDCRDSSQTSRTLKCMSIGFLLKDPKDSVVWRGPKKNAMIRQFLADVRWGELDWLIIDTPPGTSDEHISLLEQLGTLLTHQSTSSTTENVPTLSSVLVTTPQAVSLLDVSKEFDFTKKTGLKVIGLIENMSGYLCPHCNQIQYVFGSGGGLSFCQKVSNQVAQQTPIDSEQPDLPSQGSQEQTQELKFLGKLPIDIQFMKLMDQANQSVASVDSTFQSNRPAHPSSPPERSDLIERYLQTNTSEIFREICDQIVRSITS